MREDLARALAYLDRALEVAPGLLDLYLERAQILQYGLNDCGGALKDYRHVLRELEGEPDESLSEKCRQGIRDMMALDETSLGGELHR
jgi:hypothetical protein